MLALESTSTVSRGLPAGGGICRTRVGFKTSTKTRATAQDIRPITVAQRAGPIAAGRRRAYQTRSSAAARRSPSHNEDGIRDSTLHRVIIRFLTAPEPSTPPAGTPHR